ncbi:hypothetical protein ACJMK2_017770 [Sinanodonta woodiana]|uniref:C-type lectin domain-containing protein n=1 Tax=Sinanodonta woodiana TaxID=1069815 RepID=A0ABD3UBG7_SINWO
MAPLTWATVMMPVLLCFMTSSISSKYEAKDHHLVERLMEKIHELHWRLEYIKKSLTEVRENTCPKNYIRYVGSDERHFCYRYEANTNHCLNYTNAREACQLEGGDLIQFSEENFNFFVTYGKAFMGDACNQNFWIGAKRGEPGTNEFYYVGGGFLNGSDTRYWNSSPQADVDCVAQTNSSSENKLDAKDCSLTGGYICQVYLRTCEDTF